MIWFQRGRVWDANLPLNLVAVALAPDDYQIYLTRGLAFAGTKDYGAAAFDYGFVIYRNPDYALAFLFRGLVRLQLDQNADASADFDHFINTDGNNSVTCAHRRLAKERTGDIDGALAEEPF